VLCVLDKKAYNRVLRNQARAKLAVVADQLQRVAVVCDWRRSMVLRVAMLVHTRRYSRGETITRAGTTAGMVHIICHGEVRVVHEPGEYDEPGAHGAAAVHLPGDRLRTSLLGAKPRPIELAVLGASPASISSRGEQQSSWAPTVCH
jgi:CRP-like cAMP-binding protein